MKDETEVVLCVMPGFAAAVLSRSKARSPRKRFQYRPRRQFVVTISDGTLRKVVLRFSEFYGSQIKQMAVGAQVELVVSYAMAFRRRWSPQLQNGQ